MRWETISTTDNHEVYRLKHREKTLLTLTLHPFSNTARVEKEDEKRVFQIRKEGFRRNKTVLRNEYGIKMGELGIENKVHFIDLGKERFYYNIQHNPQPELVIYKDSIDKPVLVCGLDVKSGETSIQLEKAKMPASTSTSILMALCWYMFLPVTKEDMVGQFV